MSGERAVWDRLIWLVFLGAFFLRSTEIGFGLPYLFHQDEPIVVNHALAYAGGDLNPHFFKIPPLLSYLVFALYAALYGVLKIFFHATRDGFAMLFFKDPSIFYFLGRLFFGAFLGSASVVVLYGLGRRIFQKESAFAASLLFAFSYVHVRDSHYLYVDIPMIFAMLMAHRCLLDYILSNRNRSLVFSSIWAGVSVAFKYIALPILLPLLWALWDRETGGRRKGFGARALLVVGVCALTAILLNPYSILDFGFFMREMRQQAAAESGMPFFHHLFYSLFGGVGGVVTALGFVGIALLWFHGPAGRSVAIFPVIYYVVITLFSQPYERYAMPIIPYLCLSVAYFLERLTGIFGRKSIWRGAIYCFLVLLMIWPSLAKDAQLVRILAKPDTRALATEWILSNVPPGSKIVLNHPFFAPRLRQAGEQIRKKFHGIRPEDPHRDIKAKKIDLILKAQEGQKTYQVWVLNEQGLEEAPYLMGSPLIGPNETLFEEKGIQYYVRARTSGESGFFEKRMKQHSPLLKVFSPYRDPGKIFNEDRWSNVALPFEGRELFSRTGQGPYLEIYRTLPKGVKE